MNPATTPSLGHDWPLPVIEDTQERAFAALADANAPGHDSVVWLCVHPAAVQHVVHPELTRVSKGRVVTAFRPGAVRLKRTLRTLLPMHSGDALVSNVDATRVLDTLVVEVRAQTDQEHRLRDEPAERLSTDQEWRLIANCEHPRTQAPTRPHPYAPRRQVLGRLAYLVHGARDHALDTPDSRHVPTPHRAREPVKNMRRGDFLLGVNSTDAHSDSR